MRNKCSEFRHAQHLEWGEARQRQVFEHVMDRAKSIYGLKSHLYGSQFEEWNKRNFYLEYERAWSVGATMHLNFDHSFTDVADYEIEGTKYRVYHVKPKVSISWSSTGRDVGNALASIALYEEVTKLGAELEAHFADGFYVIRSEAELKA